ncbi:MAG: 2-dehydro-3-deoxygalactonokinase [Pseudomonadota bacterium]
MTVADWIAVDWGTTHVRAWAMGADKTVLAATGSNKGMGALQPEEFEPALLELAASWLPPGRSIDVLACGMVGARQGWVEADYLPVPTPPLVPARFRKAEAANANLAVSIIPGLKQSDPPDVMRGEETQIAGFLSQDQAFEGMLIMPGTHTKWVRVAEGRVLSFNSFMSGELFALLENHSVLRHSLAGDELSSAVFQETVGAVLADPGLAMLGLFRLRAEDLLQGRGAAVLRAKLSAYLIGAEISAARAQWQGERCVLIGSPALTDLYGKAFHLAGCAHEIHSADTLTLQGLCAAKDLLMEAKV